MSPPLFPRLYLVWTRNYPTASEPLAFLTNRCKKKMMKCLVCIQIGRQTGCKRAETAEGSCCPGLVHPSVSLILWDHTPGNLQSPLDCSVPSWEVYHCVPISVGGGMLSCKLKLPWENKTGKTSAMLVLFMSHFPSYFFIYWNTKYFESKVYYMLVFF